MGDQTSVQLGTKSNPQDCVQPCPKDHLHRRHRCGDRQCVQHKECPGVCLGASADGSGDPSGGVPAGCSRRRTSRCRAPCCSCCCPHCGSCGPPWTRTDQGGVDPPWCVSARRWCELRVRRCTQLRQQAHRVIIQSTAPSHLVDIRLAELTNQKLVNTKTPQYLSLLWSLEHHRGERSCFT